MWFLVVIKTNMSHTIDGKYNLQQNLLHCATSLITSPSTDARWPQVADVRDISASFYICKEDNNNNNPLTGSLSTEKAHWCQYVYKQARWPQIQAPSAQSVTVSNTTEYTNLYLLNQCAIFSVFLHKYFTVKCKNKQMDKF